MLLLILIDLAFEKEFVGAVMKDVSDGCFWCCANSNFRFRLVVTWSQIGVHIRVEVVIINQPNPHQKEDKNNVKANKQETTVACSDEGTKAPRIPDPAT